MSPPPLRCLLRLVVKVSAKAPKVSSKVQYTRLPSGISPGRKPFQSKTLASVRFQAMVITPYAMFKQVGRQDDQRHQCQGQQWEEQNRENCRQHKQKAYNEGFHIDNF